MAHYIFWIFVLLICKPVMGAITGPTLLTISVGETAHFKWNNTNDNPALIYATWGIRKGNIADPQFINVDITSSKVNLNSVLESNLMKRLSFDGDLKKGLAWFTLRNVTVNDTNEYIASISEDVTRVLHRTVALTVKERKKEEQNMIDVTTKGTITKEVVPSMFPRISKTSTTKETVTAPNEPEEPSLSHSKTIVIFTVATICAVSLITIVIVFAKKTHLRKKKRKQSPSERKLMECKA